MASNENSRYYGMNGTNRFADSESQEIASLAERLTRKHNALNSKFIRCSIATVVIMLVLMATGFFGMWYFMNHSLDSMTSSPSFCLPCEDLALNTDNKEEIKELFQSDKKGVCCATNATLMHAMLQKFHEKQSIGAEAEKQHGTFGNDYNPEFIPAGAHLIRKKPHHKEHNNILDSWNDNAEGTFRKNVTLKNGHLVIVKPGFYSIYSHVSFSQELSKAMKKRSASNVPVFMHSVHKKKLLGSDRQKTLLTASKTHSSPMNDFVIYHTSYLSGVFSLEQGEAVYVKVCNSSCISHNLHSTYFGLFRLF